MLRARGLRNHTTTSTTLSCNAITSMTWQHCRQYDLASTSRRGQITSVASSPTWLSIYITSWPSHLDSTIASMTQYVHCIAVMLPRQRRHQHDLTALSLAWLDIYITPQPSHLDSVIASMTQQHRHQHDSTSTSRSGQVASATPSPAWLGIYITPWPSRLSSTVASRTR
jgi:hypothetical protein